MQKLKEKYKDQVIPAMMQKFGYKNPMAVPKITRVTVNTSFGKNVASKTSSEREKMQKLIAQDVALIAGQQ
ncbi:MAG: 50S ribosomal protein L5, partial [Candidatus Staskawiczbacteria bacterium RIFCSPHIGHO2_12_FULL_38_11]